MYLNRRAFTLAEMLVALTLGGLAATIVLKLLNTTQRASQVITERINVQQNLRDGVYFLTTSMRELNAGAGDIIQMDSTSLRVRGMTWTSVLCAPPAAAGTNVLLAIRDDAFFGSQVPNPASDSLLIYRDNDPAVSGDDSWLPGGLLASTTGACADGTSARVLTVNVPASAGGTDSVTVGVTTGAPIRSFQAREVAVLNQGGRSWLGIAAASRTGVWSTPQPLLGPLQANGLSLRYLDSLEAVTAVSTEVAAIQLVLRGESMGRARTSTGTIDFIRDSLTTRIAVRNNPR